MKAFWLLINMNVSSQLPLSFISCPALFTNPWLITSAYHYTRIQTGHFSERSATPLAPPSGVRSNRKQARVAPRHNEVTNEISLTSAGTAKVAYLQTCMCEGSVKENNLLKNGWKCRRVVPHGKWPRCLHGTDQRVWWASRPFSVTWLSVWASWLGAAKLTVATKRIHWNRVKTVGWWQMHVVEALRTQQHLFLRIIRCTCWCRRAFLIPWPG